MGNNDAREERRQPSKRKRQTGRAFGGPWALGSWLSWSLWWYYAPPLGGVREGVPAAMGRLAAKTGNEGSGSFSGVDWLVLVTGVPLG